LVQWYSTPPQVLVWQAVAGPQEMEVPALHVPLARFDPQPWQVRPVVTVAAVQMSAQLPGSVRQPENSSQSATQHWFVAPAAHTVGAAVHEQSVQVSSLPLQVRVQVSG
jgi:hypothetical protein